MLISEIKEQIEVGKTVDDLLEVKQYLSIIEKNLIVNKVIDSCITIDENNGLSKIDYFYKKLTTDILLLVNYTNIEFSENLIEDYDYLCEFIGLEWIIDKISPIEVYIIQELVDEELDQIIKLNNSIESVVASKLQQLITAIPSEKSIKKIMNDIPKQINKIKPDQLSIIKDMIGKQNEGEVNG